MKMDEQPMNLDLMEDSIQVFKIFKLLQRMRNKWIMDGKSLKAVYESELFLNTLIEKYLTGLQRIKNQWCIK